MFEVVSGLLVSQGIGERPERPLSADNLPLEVWKLGCRGDWAGGGGLISVGSEVSGTLYLSSNWCGDSGCTVSGSYVDV